MAANPFQYAVNSVKKKATELFNQSPYVQGAQMYGRMAQSKPVQNFVQQATRQVQQAPVQVQKFNQAINKPLNFANNQVNSQLGGLWQGLNESYSAPYTNKTSGYSIGRGISGGALAPVTAPIQLGSKLLSAAPHVLNMANTWNPYSSIMAENEKATEKQIAKDPLVKKYPELAETTRMANRFMVGGILFSNPGASRNFKGVDLKKAFHPEDEKVMRDFAVQVERTGGKKDLGQLGKDAHSVIEKYFGRKFTSLSNKQAQKMFDYTLAKIDNARTGNGAAALELKPKGFQLPVGLQSQEVEGLAQQGLRSKQLPKYKTIHAGGKIKMVEGEPVKIIDGVDTFIHKGDGGWVVSESSTGRYLADSRSKEGAIAKAHFNISNVGEDKFKQLITENQISKPSLPKELEGLAGEARKYKSAEEFVKAQENKLVGEYENISKQISELPKKKKLSLLEYGIEDKLNQDLGRKGAELTKFQQTKSQLTDIYNQAKGVQSADLSFKLPVSPQLKVVNGKLRTKNVPIDAPKLEMRGFTESVLESPTTPLNSKIKVKTQPSSYYNPSSNPETLKQVQRVVSKGEDYALSVARDPNNPLSNATAMDLMGRYIKDGKFNKLNVLINEVNPRFTQQGQQIQILSQYGKLTPQGSLRYAQNVLKEANKYIPQNKQLTLSKQSIKEISSLASAIRRTKDGSRDQIVAIAKLLDRVAAEVPVSLGQKVSTIQTMAQLLNPKTLIRNTVGNTGFAAIENVKDVIASGIDKGVSKITGVRTKILPSVGTQLRGAKEGFSLGLDDALKGIDTSGGIQTQYDLPTRTFRKGILSKGEKVLNIGLRATDRAAYTAAYNESLRQQMKLAGVGKPTEQMMEIAKGDGLYRTFQDTNRISDIFVGIKKILNKIGISDGKFGLGDLILKYPKTPANLLARAVDYSPAGYVKAFMELYRPITRGVFNQKQFVESLSRALTGSGIIAIGYILGKTGIATGKPNKDTDVRALQRTTGEGGFKFNTDAFKRFVESGFNEDYAKPQNGDTLVSFDWFQPQSFSFAMGINAANGSKDAQDYLSSWAEGLNEGVQTLAEQPLVSGVTRFAQTSSLQGATKAFMDSALGAPASFIPSILNQTGQLTDNTTRETYDPNAIKESVVNKVLARIPGARNTLKERIDIEGKPLETYQDGTNSIFNVFFNPAFVSKIKRNPEAAEVLRLLDATGETKQAPRLVDKKITINGEDKQLTADQYQQYQTYVGQKTKQMFNELITTPQWKSISDEDKVKELQSVLTDINSAAKIQLFGNKPKNISGDTKRIIYREGVATPNVKVSPNDATALRIQAIKEADPLNTGSTAPKGNDVMSLIQQAEAKKQNISDAVALYKDTTIPDSKKDAVWKSLGTTRSEVEFKALASMEDTEQASILFNLLKERNGDINKVNTFIEKEVLTNNVVTKMEDQGLINEQQAKDLKAYIKNQNVKLGKVAPSKGKKPKKLKIPKLKAIKVKYTKLKIKIPKPKKYKSLLAKPTKNKYFI